MTSGRSLVDGDCDWSPLYRPVDLSFLCISVPASLVSMAAQEVMKHYTILEEAARNWLDGDYESCVRLTICWQDSRLEYGVSLESCQYLVSFELVVKLLITCWTVQLQTKSGEVNVWRQHLVILQLWRGWTYSTMCCLEHWKKSFPVCASLIPMFHNVTSWMMIF